MKNAIKLNQDTAIDLTKLIDSRLLVQANSGMVVAEKILFL